MPIVVTLKFPDLDDGITALREYGVAHKVNIWAAGAGGPTTACVMMEKILALFGDMLKRMKQNVGDQKAGCNMIRKNRSNRVVTDNYLHS